MIAALSIGTTTLSEVGTSETCTPLGLAINYRLLVALKVVDLRCLKGVPFSGYCCNGFVLHGCTGRFLRKKFVPILKLVFERWAISDGVRDVLRIAIRKLLVLAQPQKFVIRSDVNLGCCHAW